ncbi:DAK2 domain-containing protein [Fodinicola acaciae]|uniref:DAK2 domain-containing protein n=1 Tax=Fodinicola acaciae TaxID=2681555 RepID=UPI0013D8054F|nr:DAK2 domain-containing protein [Fodinicola acaciae]
MSTPDGVFDAAIARRWCAAGLAKLRRHRDEINGLNVFPVPDADTGTNLVLTMRSACRSLADGKDAQRVGEVLRHAARGALLGARGNSGVIVAEFLRGMADALAGHRVATPAELAEAFTVAADACTAAVEQPLEGTVLSVARAAAEAAKAAGDLASVCEAATDGAAQALQRTTSQLPALAAAGVVDAGGRGLLVLFEALTTVATGGSILDDDTDEPEETKPAGPPAYEVQYLLDATRSAVDHLRRKLAPLGDSLAVVSADQGTWNVHVHVNDIGAAIEAGIQSGRPHHISVTRFADQLDHAPHAGHVHQPPVEPERPAGRAVLVIIAGTGLAQVLEEAGAAVLAASPVRAADVRASIDATGAAEVIIVCLADVEGEGSGHAAVDTAAHGAREDGRRVTVVPVASPVQALAATAVFDPERRFDDVVITMAETAGATRWAELVVATKESLTVAGRARAGDVVALVEGEVIAVTDGSAEEVLASALTDLIDRLLSAGGELVTVVTGADAPDGLAELVEEHVAARWPLAEAQVFAGGQVSRPVLVGVE